MSERAAAQSSPKHVFRLESRTPEQTSALGALLGERIAPGTVVTLSGPFGAGKTTLVQGLGRGLGILSPIVSPSFALVNEYPALATGARITLFHADLYRIQSTSEAYDLRLDDYLDQKAVLAVEWPEIAFDFLPIDRLSVHIRDRDAGRDIEISATGPTSLELLTAIKEMMHAFEVQNAKPEVA